MLSTKSFFFVVLVCLVNDAHQKKLPFWITRCKLNNDGKVLGECIKKVFDEHRDKFVAGIPEMHVPSLDPFIVDKVNFNTGQGSAIGVDAVFTNIRVFGGKDVVIDRIESDITNAGKAILELHMPLLNIKSDYVMNGRIMVVPINGSGEADGNFTGIHAINTFKGEFETRNNKQYIKWSDQKIDLTMKGSTLYFDNLFNGNKELTETTNKVLNDNSNEIMKELKPLVEETISSITFSMLQQVFHTYSVDELFEK